MNTDLRFEEEYPYPPARVWRALTDPAAIADWLMPNDFAPRVGHRFEMRTQPAPGFDGIVRCEVTVCAPPSCLAFTWKGGNIDTLVTFRLAPVEGGTRLTLVHSGFAGVKGWMVSRILGSGWRKKILPVSLRAALGRFQGDRYTPAAAVDEATCAKERGDRIA